MKFNPTSIRAGGNTRAPRISRFQDRAACIPLDSVFNGLLIAAGVALSVAGAADAALDLRATPIAAAQASTIRRDGVQYVAVCGQSTTRVQPNLELSPRTKS